jgi:hypothetical protein
VIGKIRLNLIPAAGGAVEQQLPFTFVAREPSRPLELGARLAEPPELLQEIAAHARQQVIGLELSSTIGDGAISPSAP